MKHLPTANRRDVLDCLFDGVEAADGSGIFKPDRQVIELLPCDVED
jgi:hypothetical protein